MFKQVKNNLKSRKTGKKAFDFAAQCHSAYTSSFFSTRIILFSVICVPQLTRVQRARIIRTPRFISYFVVVPVCSSSLSLKKLFHTAPDTCAFSFNFLALFYLFPLFTSSLYACGMLVVLVGFHSASYLFTFVSLLNH